MPGSALGRVGQASPLGKVILLLKESLCAAASLFASATFMPPPDLLRELQDLSGPRQFCCGRHIGRADAVAAADGWVVEGSRLEDAALGGVLARERRARGDNGSGLQARMRDAVEA